MAVPEQLAALAQAEAQRWVAVIVRRALALQALAVTGRATQEPGDVLDIGLGVGGHRRPSGSELRRSPRSGASPNINQCEGSFSPLRSLFSKTSTLSPPRRPAKQVRPFADTRCHRPQALMGS